MTSNNYLKKKFFNLTKEEFNNKLNINKSDYENKKKELLNGK
jgi:thermostable 8-oxoguanine DNA glycosylase